jgi:hypothetical protein
MTSSSIFDLEKDTSGRGGKLHILGLKDSLAKELKSEQASGV